MQDVLTHPDRRVRTDRAEGDALRNIFGLYGVDVVEAEFLRVAADEVESPLVDVHGPDRGARGVEGEGQRDRTPAASEVEQMTAGRWWGSVRQEHRRPAVDVVGTEHPASRRHLDIATGEGHTDAAEVLRAGRGRAEVMVAPHATSVAEAVPGAGS